MAVRNENVITDAMDWPAFLSQHDPIWERLPATWMEGAFIGNGRLGAMIYKGDGEEEPGADVLAWTIGRSDLYDDRHTGNGDQRTGFDMGGHCRLPMGPTPDGLEDTARGVYERLVVARA